MTKFRAAWLAPALIVFAAACSSGESADAEAMDAADAANPCAVEANPCAANPCAAAEMDGEMKDDMEGMDHGAMEGEAADGEGAMEGEAAAGAGS